MLLLPIFRWAYAYGAKLWSAQMCWYGPSVIRPRLNGLECNGLERLEDYLTAKMDGTRRDEGKACPACVLSTGGGVRGRLPRHSSAHGLPRLPISPITHGLRLGIL